MSYFEEYRAKPLTKHQEEIIKRGIKTMEERNDLDVKPLPAFESAYRARKGINIMFENTNKKCEKVSEENRKIKAGSGRKAKTIENVYYKTINENFDNYYLRRNLDCLLTGAVRQFVGNSGQPEVSYSVLKSIITGNKELNAKMLMDEMYYSKSQAYKIFKVYKWLMTMNVNLLEE